MTTAEIIINDSNTNEVIIIKAQKSAVEKHEIDNGRVFSFRDGSQIFVKEEDILYSNNLYWE